MILNGRFEIIGSLGTGSMGTVYRSRDTMLGREVALKTIRAESNIDEQVRERFYQEARACARLHHPNIITVFDLGESDGMMYIAMELLQGEDLRRIIERQQPFPLEKQIALMIEVCTALDHAHGNGVVHRDIKPSNIFVVSGEHAKVLDFGIARLTSSTLTSEGKVLGTPNYMAPEQILSRTCDGRSDLFAAAMVFFEFVTGVHPFQSLFIPNRIANGSPDLLCQVKADLPASLEAVLARALENKPGFRYQTGRAFAADLEKVLAEVQGAVTAPREGFVPQTGLEGPNSRPVKITTAGADTRLCEFVQLMREFESASESESASVARRAFEEMKKLQAVDDRFTAAVGDCGQRLLEMKADPTDPPPPAVQPEKVLPVVADPEATVAVDVPATFMRPDRMEATQIVDWKGGQAARAPALTPPPPPPPPAQPAKLPPARSKPAAPAAQARGIRSGWIIGVVLVLLGATGGVAFFVISSRKIAVLSGVGTAGVIAAESQIREAPLPNAKSVYTLRKGDSVNVLKSPANARPTWLQVQLATGDNVSRPGYVRASDLGNWSTLALWLNFPPDDAATNAQRAEYVAALEEALARTPDSPDAARVNLRIAEESVVLARADRDAGQSGGEWLDRADRALRVIRSVPDLRIAADELRLNVRTLRRPLRQTHPDEPAAAPRVNPYDREPDFLLAEADWQAARYTAAEKRLKHILKRSPHFEKAVSLLEKVRKARAIDPGVF
jgi:tRNA A-37 threonylcarbamoyl transferase component Bud32